MTIQIRTAVHYLLIIVSALIMVNSNSQKAQSADQVKPSDKAVVSPTEEVAVLTTTMGTIVLKFFPDVAPGHVENFKKLTNSKFYDGVKFHRVIKGFMIQTGCPNSKDKAPSEWGRGGPGWTVKAEFSKKPHLRGTLSMARSTDPNSAGSQFFICHQAAPHLDGQYTVFGETVEGLDVVDKIAESEVIRDRPISVIAIEKAEIMKWEDYSKRKSQNSHLGSSVFSQSLYNMKLFIGSKPRKKLFLGFRSADSWVLAISDREPGQIRKEAALSILRYVRRAQLSAFYFFERYIMVYLFAVKIVR